MRPVSEMRQEMQRPKPSEAEERKALSCYHHAIAAEIQRRCAEKWPEAADKAGTLAVCQARVGKPVLRLSTIRRAYQTGVVSLLAAREIAKALDCTMHDILDAGHAAVQEI